jgi:hypothetical protein
MDHFFRKLGAACKTAVTAVAHGENGRYFFNKGVHRNCEFLVGYGKKDGDSGTKDTHKNDGGENTYYHYKLPFQSKKRVLLLFGYKKLRLSVLKKGFLYVQMVLIAGLLVYIKEKWFVNIKNEVLFSGKILLLVFFSGQSGVVSQQRDDGGWWSKALPGSLI